MKIVRGFKIFVSFLSVLTLGACGEIFTTGSSRVETNGNQVFSPDTLPVFPRERPESPELTLEQTKGVYTLQEMECEGNVQSKFTSTLELIIDQGVGHLVATDGESQGIITFTYELAKDEMSLKYEKSDCVGANDYVELTLPTSTGEFRGSCSTMFTSDYINGKFQFSGNSLIRKFYEPYALGACRWIMLKQS